MQSKIRTFSYPNGEIQRVHVVQPESWKDLDFLNLSYQVPALDCFCRVYRQFLVPECPWLFGQMVMFCLPEDVSMPFSYDTRNLGSVADRLTAAAAALEAGVHIAAGKPVFRNDAVKSFWQTLEQRDCIRLVRGKLPVTTIIPVGPQPGFLTRTEETARMKVNASFFIMDSFDCATLYDHIGAPLGLCVKNGIVDNPPLYRREALLVRKDGTARVEIPDMKQMDVEIAGVRYRHGVNCRIYTRPGYFRTPPGKGKKLILIGRQVAAVYDGLSAPVPASGVVLYPEGQCDAKPGDLVTYHGMEDVLFGIQVGNSIVRDGQKTTSFQSKYYNIRHLEPVPFPPSLYPLNFKRARAARIALGADEAGKPMILWAEGAGKIRYTPGQDSCGASLSEMAEICTAVGMVNGVNLDGGGSAQILVNNRRSLLISDRKAEDNTESERPVPNGLIVR